MDHWNTTVWKLEMFGWRYFRLGAVKCTGNRGSSVGEDHCARWAVY